MNKSALLLSSALVFWSANADNTKPPVLGANAVNENEVVTVYWTANKVDKFNDLVSDTSLNIAQVVNPETKTVLFSEWCNDNPKACERLDQIRAEREADSKIASKENPTNVWIIVKWKTFWLGLETENIYWEVTSNFDDEIWVWVAYKDKSWLVAWWSYADKKSVGSQTWVWAWYVKSFDNSYVWAWVKYTNFNAKGIYADADSVKAQVMWAYELTSWLFAEATVGYKTFKADTYDRESRVEGSLGFAYMTPEFTARIASTINQSSNQVMATLSFPIGGKNKVSAANLWQSSMARFIADSSFDNSIVRVKKEPIVTPEVQLPAQTLSISTSWPIISWANTDNMVADNWPLTNVEVSLNINSPYTLSSSLLTFNPNVWLKTQTVNVLHNGNVVWTRTISVTWQ